MEYDLEHLFLIYKNISNLKSNIYTKKKIIYMINKKKKLIIDYDNLYNKIQIYQLYLNNNNLPQSEYVIYLRLSELNKKLDYIIQLLNKLEWEENLILSILTIKKENNFLTKIKKLFIFN